VIKTIRQPDHIYQVHDRNTDAQKSAKTKRHHHKDGGVL
jgi:hypothetical protein